jgi:ABC-type transporter MlaC component
MNTIAHAARILSATVALFTIIASSTPSLAENCPAAGTIKNAASALVVAAQRGSAPAFASALVRYADVNAIALSALGKYRSGLPGSRQGEYVRNAYRYMSQSLAKHAGSFGKSSNLTIESCDGNLVETSLSGRSKMLWRLSGGRIRDVRVSGVWLAIQLRSKFTDIIGRNGGDVTALLDFLARVDVAAK